MAIENGYEVELVEADSEWAKDPDECFERNSHGVPRDVIKRMAEKYQTNEEVLKGLKEG
jgi:hypothetical protein